MSDEEEYSGSEEEEVEEEVQETGEGDPEFIKRQDQKRSDLDEQLVINKIDELKKSQKFPGWKVGDMTQAITDGNFE